MNLVLGLMLLGCGDVEIEAEGSVTTTMPSRVTWDDVGPIIEQNCTGCHQPGGASPFALTTYAEVTAWAPQIALAVQERTMPPWLVTDDDDCGSWQDEQWLSQDEIDIVVDWVAAGVPQGEVSQEPLVPQEPFALDRVDLVLQTPEDIPEAEGDLLAPNDEYRCYLFENPEEADFYITGYQVNPGFDAIVHHVLAMPVDPDAVSYSGATNAEEVASMEAQDERPGWDCLGTSGGAIRERGMPVSWAPGQGGVEFPEGTGVFLGADEWLVVQIHYNLSDPLNVGIPDSTAVELRTESMVESPLYTSLADPLLFSLFNFPNMDTLPEGEPAYEYTWEMTAYEVIQMGYASASGATGFWMHGVMPHMHGYGTSMKAKVVRDVGLNECVADVPRWDFEWQRIYNYEEPVWVGMEDSVKVTCTYDTTSAPSPVIPGWGTQNEMCLFVMLITVE